MKQCVRRCLSAVLAVGLAAVGWLYEPGSSDLVARAEAGSMVIGGRRMSCGAGTPKANNTMGSLGIAVPSSKIFFLNKRRLRQYPVQFQRFVFLHECAHMYMRNERAADCWAIRRGIYRGLLSRRGIEQTCKALWATPSGLYHNAGPQRCEHLKQCWSRAMAERRNRTASRRKR